MENAPNEQSGGDGDGLANFASPNPFAFKFADSGSGGNSGGSGEPDEFRFDPERHVSPDKQNADGSFTRKRGRKPNGGTSTRSGSRKKGSNSASVEAVSRMLGMVHLGLAASTKTPELMLEDAEAMALSTAILNVADQFDFRPDPKIEVTIGLIITAATIYGPRAYNIRERLKKEKET